ncbi:MAG: hypothetical protein EU544_05415 [Promethearchaeota archaeon]|nr:MAG: hypothetical protein EU544_05415 [Candidatus Lokiarchaeota archaeon]
MSENKEQRVSTFEKIHEFRQICHDLLWKWGNTLRSFINKIRKRFWDFITDFKVVKIAGLLVIPGYLGLVFIGVIVAYLCGGTAQNPGEYFIWTNWISDLGGRAFTPAPYLYDIACILAGILTIPFTFYMEKLFAPLPNEPWSDNKYSRLRYRISSYALLASIIGNLGYIGVGIFSEDRSPELFGLIGAHGFMSSLAFGGFTFGAFFTGWLIVIYDVKVPKTIGFYGIFGPLITIILFGVYSNPLWEWLLLFSILLWIIPIALVIIRKEELQV